MLYRITEQKKHRFLVTSLDINAIIDAIIKEKETTANHSSENERIRSIYDKMRLSLTSKCIIIMKEKENTQRVVIF